MKARVLLVATSLILGFSIITLAEPNLITQTYAQKDNESEKMTMANMSNVSAAPGKITFNVNAWRKDILHLYIRG